MFCLIVDATAAGDFLVFKKRDCSGNDIAPASLNLHIEDCLEYCLSDAGCVGVAYFFLHYPRCYPKYVCMPYSFNNSLHIINSRKFHILPHRTIQQHDTLIKRCCNVGPTTMDQHYHNMWSMSRVCQVPPLLLN